MFMDDLRKEVESLRARLKKAKALLQEVPNHLDHDFNWKQSEEYAARVKKFLEEPDPIRKT
jgi:hypothetical protein